MAEQNKSQGLGFALLIAASVLAIGVLIASLYILWQAAKPPKRAATTSNASAVETSPSFTYEFEALPDTEPEPEQPRSKPDLDLDPENLRVRQELFQEQIQALRALAREDTNLSFGLTEEQIDEMEREGISLE